MCKFLSASLNILPFCHQSLITFYFRKGSLHVQFFWGTSILILDCSFSHINLIFIFRAASWPNQGRCNFACMKEMLCYGFPLLQASRKYQQRRNILCWFPLQWKLTLGDGNPLLLLPLDLGSITLETKLAEKSVWPFKPDMKRWCKTQLRQLQQWII